MCLNNHNTKGERNSLKKKDIIKWKTLSCEFINFYIVIFTLKLNIIFPYFFLI
jgi:hypothetical protein